MATRAPKAAPLARTAAATPSSASSARAASAFAGALALQRAVGNRALRQLLTGLSETAPVALPPPLRDGIERRSRVPLDDVKVHYNSWLPPALSAAAYTEGARIHVAPGQERALPHEAWHVVQQRQGRVRPTRAAGGVSLNDDPRLEAEADAESRRALESGHAAAPLGELSTVARAPTGDATIQLTKIELDAKIIAGSEEEDTGTFWTAFTVLYKDSFHAGLAKLVRLLDARWRKGAASDWDRKILSDAVKKFAEDAGYNHYQPLGDDTAAKVRAALLGLGEAAEDAPIAASEINMEALGALASALETYAAAELRDMRASDDPNVPVGGDSPYGRILARARRFIWNKYGLKIRYATLFYGADNTVINNLANAHLEHSTSRWTSASAADKAQAALLAVQWTMGNVPAVRSVVASAQGRLHKQSSSATVQAAYARALVELAKTNPKAQAVLDQLAEVRLRWGPITYGPNIYMEIARAKPNLDEQWRLLKILIHEALHSAEHPNFTAFLAESVPEGLRSDLKEGIVEYLTGMIWADALSTVATKDRPSLDEGPAGKGVALAASAGRAATMASASDPQYAGQVAMVKTIIALIGDQGTARVEAAYFYGNVEALLPRLVGMVEERGGGSSSDESTGERKDKSLEKKTKAPEKKTKSSAAAGPAAADREEQEAYAALADQRAETDAAFVQEQGGAYWPAVADDDALARALENLVNMYRVRLPTRAKRARVMAAFDARYDDWGAFLVAQARVDSADGRAALYRAERALWRKNYQYLLAAGGGGMRIGRDRDIIV